jgi:tryptophan synthase alpha chain
MENRIKKLFTKKGKNILSIYFTAGYPYLDSTSVIINELQKSRVDMLEIGIPFSDPLADGKTIQESSETALKNGMSLKLLFEQLKNVRKTIDMPLLLMGYLNPVLQYGVKNFCKKCREIDIDGVIIPDLPVQEYLDDYKEIFDEHNLNNIFLITPQSSDERIRWIDKNSNGFIYAVSSFSITGNKLEINERKKNYFEKIRQMNLKNPIMIGFGISDKNSFEFACEYANGAIIGSAFINAIKESKNLNKSIKNFISTIKK